MPTDRNISELIFNEMTKEKYEELKSTNSINNNEFYMIKEDDVAEPTIYVSNPNLLHNWYFANPVNQNGRTAYEEVVGTIDRWIASATSTAKVELVENGVKFSNTSDSSTTYFRQRFNSTLPAGTYTLSALVDEIVGNPRFYFSDSSGNSYPTIADGSLYVQKGLTSLTIEVEANKVARIQGQLPAGASITVRAIKLELGNTQTLAHQDENDLWVLNEIPSYAEQMAICTQYDPVSGNYIGFPSIGGDTSGITVTLSANNWATQADGSYAQTVSVSGVTADSQVIVDCALTGSDIASDIAVLKDWGYVNRASQASGSLTFYCYGEKPTISLPLNMVVI